MAYVISGSRLQPTVTPVSKGREATSHSWANAAGTTAIEPRVRGLDAISVPLPRVGRITLAGKLRVNGTYRDMCAPYNPPKAG